MSNINLYQEEQVSEKTTRAVFLDKGLIIGVVIFVIVLLVYGGVKMYLSDLNNKIETSQKETSEARRSLDGKSVNLAASFQQRLDLMQSGKEVFIKSNPAGVFQAVQTALVEGVVVSEISLQEKDVKIAFQSGNFEVLAKQILSFKKNPAFQGVEVTKSARSADESGASKVESELTMQLNF